MTVRRPGQMNWCSSYVAHEQLISKVEKLLIHLLISYSSNNKTDCFLKHGSFHKGSPSFLFLRADSFFFRYLNWEACVPCQCCASRFKSHYLTVGRTYFP